MERIEDYQPLKCNPLPFVSSFMYCKDLDKDITPDGQEIDKLIKPLHGLEPSKETGCYSFRIVCCLGGLVLGENAIRLQFRSSEGEVLQQTPEILLYMSQKMLKEDDTYQFNFNVKELEIRDGGVCTTVVIVNGWVIASFKILALEETEYI